MTRQAKIRDRNGEVVCVGDRVQYLFAEGQWFENLPPEEKVRVESMIGQTFEIIEVDEYGVPWIVCEWEDEPGEYEAHKIALDGPDMVLVSRLDSPRRMWRGTNRINRERRLNATDAVRKPAAFRAWK